MQQAITLANVFDGWNGYQTSLVHAIEPLTREQLAWRPAENRRSVAELVRHIALGRITWFSRMGGPNLERAMARVPQWVTDSDGERHADEASVRLEDAIQATEWLKVSWEPVQAVLASWSVADLTESYRHRFQETYYLISRQWTVWRIMAHDIHHGGQIVLTLAMQGVTVFHLGALGGHIIEPPIAPTAG